MNSKQSILSWSLCFALGAWVLFMGASYMVVDIDLFHEMALFRQILETGTMPLADDFAYTPTLTQVIHHEWGTGAILYAVSVGTGWEAGGIVALKYVLCFATGIGCFLLSRRNGVSVPLFAALSVVALNLGGWMAFTNVRAQLFTIVFMVILLNCIDLDRKGHRWWIALWVPVCILWANMHAGIVAGLSILAIYILSRWLEAYRESRSFFSSLNRAKYLLAVGLISALVININPYGWDYVPYLLRAIRMERPLIGEWAPIWEGGSIYYQAMFILSLAIGGMGLWNRRNESTFEMLALALAAWMAVKHVRHGSLYAVIWICLVPRLLEQGLIGETFQVWWKRQNEKMVAVAMAVAIVCIGCSIKMKFWELQVPDHPTAQGIPVFPVGAVDYLGSNQFQGNLFVPFQTGAYVSWKLYPDVKVSIDSRYEVAYPHGAVEENWKFYMAHDGWEATLKKYPSDAVLVPVNRPVLKKLDNAIQQNPRFGWRCVYRDAGNALFVRNEVAESMARTADSFQR